VKVRVNMTEKELKIMEVFSEKVVDLMVENNMNLKELSNKIKVNDIGIWVRLNRAIPLSSLIKIAKLFNVSTDYLLGLTDDKPKESEKANE
jgi:hypothetical protein